MGERDDLPDPPPLTPEVAARVRPHRCRGPICHECAPGDRWVVPVVRPMTFEERRDRLRLGGTDWRG